jgi:hypothetical protein
MPLPPAAAVEIAGELKVAAPPGREEGLSLTRLFFLSSPLTTTMLS